MKKIVETLTQEAFLCEVCGYISYNPHENHDKIHLQPTCKHEDIHFYTRVDADYDGDYDMVLVAECKICTGECLVRLNNPNKEKLKKIFETMTDGKSFEIMEEHQWNILAQKIKEFEAKSGHPITAEERRVHSLEANRSLT